MNWLTLQPLHPLPIVPLHVQNYLINKRSPKIKLCVWGGGGTHIDQRAKCSPGSSFCHCSLRVLNFQAWRNCQSKHCQYWCSGWASSVLLNPSIVCVLVGHDGSQLFNREEIFSCFYTIFYDSFLRSYIYILIFIIIVLDFKVNNF